ncbi:MAG TPA: TonB family protein [Candidatus Acidoferrales bacterium]|nr:TonB family protein [Candidatus Acidoferrales bacterium]
METISRYLLTFLLNSIWQIPLAAALAALFCRLMRNGPASHRHAVWAAALLAATLLPLASLRNGETAAGPQFAIPFTVQDLAPALATPGKPTAAPAPAAPAARSRTVSFAETTATFLVGAYLLFVLFRLARLAWACMRTLQTRQNAQAGAVPLLVEDVWRHCQQAFGLTGVALLSSGQVSGPVAAGRTIILPDSLLPETSEDVLTTAIGHEMAHIARRDFACNLVYELLYLPVSFHPAAWLIHRSIERTREMACDELVTHRLLDAGVYARSIMSIATGMTAMPRPGYGLGVFDGDILEERIRRLVEHPGVERTVANLKRARLLLAAGLSALAICAVLASSLALTARAQGGASAAMKLAEAAYNRGDFQAAVQNFENAVKLDPANVNPKLFLANALLQQCEPRPLPGQSAAPWLAAARQQYLDVLTREPRNSPALDGLLGLAVNTSQFGEAHDWAMKAIQADPKDKGAYYTAAFVDWRLVYPDYANARTAAGMKPQDPGIIPDAGARKKLRDQHQSRIEDGFRMLQVALAIDPNYADAMAYMNLLYRIESGIVDTAAESAGMVAKADEWVGKALAAKRQQARNGQSLRKQLDPQPEAATINVDGPPPAPPAFAPPPPPPPPPPPASAGAALAQALPELQPLTQVNPVYPPLAKQAGISGTVTLVATVRQDGHVDELWAATGHPLLIPAALEAVRQWTYPPQSARTKTKVQILFANQ